MATEEPTRIYAVMDEDYETDSFNLGNRRYLKDNTYPLTEDAIAEIVAAGAGKRVVSTWLKAGIIERSMDTVVPNVTRWFTANGHDTHFLVKGEPKKVPSNLAVHLKLNGYAEAA